MKRILLCAAASAIEPLGLEFLAPVARLCGWEPLPFLFGDGDGTAALAGEIEIAAPDMVGFTTYTGRHRLVYSLCDLARSRGIGTIIGGPHATCFPEECSEHADFVIRGNGIAPLEAILRGESSRGCIYTGHAESPLPQPDRKWLYAAYPAFALSPIKSVLSSSGCPFACTYCYNSMDRGLFPFHPRPVGDVLEDVERCFADWPLTKLVYFQDDVFGADLAWLRAFARGNNRPYHAQARVELIGGSERACASRLTALVNSGCTGMTMALECGLAAVRHDVLDRRMDESMFFEAARRMARHDMALRTENMLGLPVGATSERTPTGLAADLATLELNVRLRRETGLPTMAWASVFTPYKGTAIYRYCGEHGFYSGDNDDVPRTFFERSVLQFPRKWFGAGEPDWMGKVELAEYRDRMLLLQQTFHLLAGVPHGHLLAEEWLTTDPTLESLERISKRHLYDRALYRV